MHTKQFRTSTLMDYRDVFLPLLRSEASEDIEVEVYTDFAMDCLVIKGRNRKTQATCSFDLPRSLLENSKDLTSKVEAFLRSKLKAAPLKLNAQPVLDTSDTLAVISAPPETPRELDLD